MKGESRRGAKAALTLESLKRLGWVLGGALVAGAVLGGVLAWVLWPKPAAGISEPPAVIVVETAAPRVRAAPPTEAVAVPASEADEGSAAILAAARRQDEPVAPAAAQAESEVPTTAGPPVGPRVQGLLATLEPPVVWAAGQLDGWPESPKEPLREEFGLLESPDEVVQVASPAELPQRLRPRQMAVLHWDDLPPGDYVFTAVLQREQPAEFYPWYSDKKGQFVELRLNDHLVYARWLNAASTWVTVYLPRGFWQDSHNRLVLANKGTRVLAFDALWLQPRAAQGEALRLALADAQWLGPEQARHVPQIALRLPDLEILELDPVSLASLTAGTAAPRPLTVAEKQRLWREGGFDPAVLGRIARSERDRQAVAVWDRQLRSILERGAEPLVIVSARRRPPPWLKLAWYYREAVRDWWLEAGDPLQAEATLNAWRQFDPEARITVEANWTKASTRPVLSSRKTAGAGPPPVAQATVQPASLNLGPAAPPTPVAAEAPPTLLPVPWSLRHGSVYRAAEDVALARRGLLQSGATFATACGQGLCEMRLRGAGDLGNVGWRCRDLAGIALNHLQQGGPQALFWGGELGGALFPEEAGQASPAWDVLALLTPLAQGEARRLPCNVLPPEASYGLLDAAWVAVRNSPDHVAIAIFADSDRGRKLTVQCPLPWPYGVCEATIRRARLPRRGGETIVFPEPQRQVLNCNPVSREESLLDAAIEVDTLTLLQIRRLGAPPLASPPILAEAPAARLDIAPKTALLERARERFPPNVWVADVTLNPRFLVEAMGPNCQVQVQPASAADYDFGTGHGIPCAPESVFVTLSSPAPYPDRPQGARVIPQPWRYQQANQLQLWVLPTCSNARLSSVNLLLRTEAMQTRILLRTGRWNLVRVPLASLGAKAGQWPRRLALVADAELPEYRADGTVSFEINGLQGLGERSPAGLPVGNEARLLRVAGDETGEDYLVVAPAGQALYWEGDLRLPGSPQRIDLPGKDLWAQYEPAAGRFRLGVPAVPAFTSEAPAASLLGLLPETAQTQAAQGKLGLLLLHFQFPESEAAKAARQRRDEAVKKLGLPAVLYEEGRRAWQQGQADVARAKLVELAGQSPRGLFVEEGAWQLCLLAEDEERRAALAQYVASGPETLHHGEALIALARLNILAGKELNQARMWLTEAAGWAADEAQNKRLAKRCALSDNLAARSKPDLRLPWLPANTGKPTAVANLLTIPWQRLAIQRDAQLWRLAASLQEGKWAEAEAALPALTMLDERIAKLYAEVIRPKPKTPPKPAPGAPATPARPPEPPLPPTPAYERLRLAIAAGSLPTDAAELAAVPAAWQPQLVANDLELLLGHAAVVEAQATAQGLAAKEQKDLAALLLLQRAIALNELEREGEAQGLLKHLLQDYPQAKAAARAQAESARPLALAPRSAARPSDSQQEALRQALRACALAERLRPGSPAALDALAMSVLLHAQLGDTAGAQQALDRLRRSYPRTSQGWQTLIACRLPSAK